MNKQMPPYKLQILARCSDFKWQRY